MEFNQTNNNAGDVNNAGPPPAYCQTITLVLADGRRVSYTGPTQLDPLFPPRVVEILVSRPRPLPQRMTWETLIEE